MVKNMTVYLAFSHAQLNSYLKVFSTQYNVFFVECNKCMGAAFCGLFCFDQAFKF